jgi:hypothetical protein
MMTWVQGRNRKYLLLGALAACALAFLAAPFAYAEKSSEKPVLLRDVGIDQKLNEQVPLDLEFRDETGRSVALR